MIRGMANPQARYGGDVISRADCALANGAHTLTLTAPAVLGGEDERAEDRADLAVAQKVDVDIEGMTVFLMSQEIV